jgi:hypothetical protein
MSAQGIGRGGRRDGIVDDDGTGGEQFDRDATDDALLARLASMFRNLDPPPSAAVELAKQSYTLRALDAELAALTADSSLDRPAVAVRSGGSDPRLLTFEAVGLAVEVEVQVSGAGRRRLLGQLLPPGPARIEFRQPAAPDPRWTDADDRGRFEVENLDPGPVSLICHQPGRRPIATEWTDLS